MQVVGILAGTKDMLELGEGESAGGASGSIGRQIPRYDIRGGRQERPEVSPATQIGTLIDDRGGIALEVGVSAGGIGSLRSRRVAVIASGHRKQADWAHVRAEASIAVQFASTRPSTASNNKLLVALICCLDAPP